jgi:hypothetical protein
MYCSGLGLHELGSRDHDGYDGVMLGERGADTIWSSRGVVPPGIAGATPEDLLIFYLPDAEEWNRSRGCRVDSPRWRCSTRTGRAGRTLRTRIGIVLCCSRLRSNVRPADATSAHVNPRAAAATPESALMIESAAASVTYLFSISRAVRGCGADPARRADGRVARRDLSTAVQHHRGAR